MPANPFNPGVYSPEQGIFGREEQLHVIDRVIARIEDGASQGPVCFTGPQGLGKTFLLRSIASQLRDRRWLCGYTEAGPDIGSAICDIFADARQMAPRRSAVRRAVARITGVSATAGPVSIGLDLQSIDNGSAYNRLVQLFREISSRAGSGFTGAALLLDEAQVLPDAHLNQLFRALGAVERSSIVLIMAALPGLTSTISSMSKSMPDPSWKRALSTPYMLVSNLEALDPVSAESVLLSPVAPEAGDFEPEAVSALVGFALGHPLTLQMLGQSAWDIAASGTPGDGKVVISAAHADEAITEVSEQLRSRYHKPAWRNCTARERAVLKKLAAMGGSAVERDLARDVKGGGPDPTATIYDLIDGGLVYDNPRTGTVSLVLPGFREFIMSV